MSKLELQESNFKTDFGNWIPLNENRCFKVRPDLKHQISNIDLRNSRLKERNKISTKGVWKNDRQVSVLKCDLWNPFCEIWSLKLDSCSWFYEFEIQKSFLSFYVQKRHVLWSTSLISDIPLSDNNSWDRIVRLDFYNSRFRLWLLNVDYRALMFGHQTCKSFNCFQSRFEKKFKLPSPPSPPKKICTNRFQTSNAKRNQRSNCKTKFQNLIWK